MSKEIKRIADAEFMPANKLEKVAAACVVEPLRPGDKRHVDMSVGRGNKSLRKLHVQLEDLAAAGDPEKFVQIAFSGHRGSGKSTELLALEHDLRHIYTSLHMECDDQLRDDYDYSCIFLWLVEEIMKLFHVRLNLSLNQDCVSHVVDWFSEIVSETNESVKKELKIETEAEAGGKIDWFGLRFGLLAKLQSMIRGSHEERTLIRQTLQRHSSDLITRLNGLLDHAHDVLTLNQLPARLLIVVDNLDRLRPHVSEPLFFQNGDLLCSLRAHIIFTVPVPIALSSRNIRLVFPYTYTLPTIKVKQSSGDEYRAGVETLESVVYARVRPELFESERPVRFLAEMSGGSVRDLVRMVGEAALAARVNGSTSIDMSAAQEAVNQMRLDFQSLLIPQKIYYPLLAKIHMSKRDGFEPGPSCSSEEVEFNRTRFYQLLHDGVIFEYNGDSKWFDVHPSVLQIEDFQQACSDGRA